jgi:hypothetical protein
MADSCTPKRPRAVGQEGLERVAHGQEGDLVPGDLGLAEQARLQRLAARIEARAAQPRQVEEVHLPHARNADGAEEGPHLEVGAGFLAGLARGALGHGLAHFHEAGRQRPLAQARLDGALAQQHAIVQVGHGAHHHQRVDVVDLAAGRADGALTRVAVVRHAVDHGRAASLAILDRVRMLHPASLGQGPGQD